MDLYILTAFVISIISLLSFSFYLLIKSKKILKNSKQLLKERTDNINQVNKNLDEIKTELEGMQNIIVKTNEVFNNINQ